VARPQAGLERFRRRAHAQGLSGMPVLELVTIGHKSREERTILITYVDDGGAPALIGSNAGRDADPAWVKNLRAEPAARARWGGAWRDVTAVELAGEARQRVWDAAVATTPGYVRYLDTMTRPIPIMRLEPTDRTWSRG